MPGTVLSTFFLNYILKSGKNCSGEVRRTACSGLFCFVQAKFQNATLLFSVLEQSFPQIPRGRPGAASSPCFPWGKGSRGTAYFWKCFFWI